MTPEKAKEAVQKLKQDEPKQQWIRNTHNYAAIAEFRTKNNIIHKLDNNIWTYYSLT